VRTRTVPGVVAPITSGGRLPRYTGSTASTAGLPVPGLAVVVEERAAEVSQGSTPGAAVQRRPMVMISAPAVPQKASAATAIAVARTRAAQGPEPCLARLCAGRLRRLQRQAHRVPAGNDAPGLRLCVRLAGADGRTSRFFTRPIAQCARCSAFLAVFSFLPSTRHYAVDRRRSRRRRQRDVAEGPSLDRSGTVVTPIDTEPRIELGGAPP